MFVDAGPDYLIDMEAVAREMSYTPFKVIIPVDLTGRPVVHRFRELAASVVRPFILRDACQSIGATYNGSPSARMSDITAYSLHPLKNVHGCGDGGMIVTDNDVWADWVRLYRNHGLCDRDTVVIPGINSRLDTLQAIAAWHMLQDLDAITWRRSWNARQYREGLRAIEEVTLPPLNPPGTSVGQVYHTFVVQVERRTELINFLAQEGVEAKIHYRVPVHLQPGYRYLGYKRGDFPNVERQADRILSLPIHEFLTEGQIDHVIEAIARFYHR